MSEKNVKTRIVHKHDTETNWNQAVNFKPKKGELIIYDPISSSDCPGIKIGDGETVVKDLPFLTSQFSYGVCDTAANVAKKVVSINNFSLTVGSMIAVKFTKANTANNPTLNVNNTGDKKIYRYGTTSASTSSTTTGWRAGAVQLFIYDGTGWIRDFWENTTYTNASLGQSYGTCNTVEGNSPKKATFSTGCAVLEGGIVTIKFTYNVKASDTLAIDDSGSTYYIYYRGSNITDNVIRAGDTATFIFSDAQYHLISIDRWQNDITTHESNTTGHITSAERTKWNNAKTHADSAHDYLPLAGGNLTGDLGMGEHGVVLGSCVVKYDTDDECLNFSFNSGVSS